VLTSDRNSCSTKRCFDARIHLTKRLLLVFYNALEAKSSRGWPLPRIFGHSVKNQAKINIGVMGESTQNRRKIQNCRTPSRRVVIPSEIPHCSKEFSISPIWGILIFAKYYIISIFNLILSFANSFQKAFKFHESCGKINHPNVDPPNVNAQD
jgi:hypothetical protein